MSYAVIKTGGKQYKVKAGEILKIEKLPDSKPDSKIEFNEILAYGDAKTIEIGSPNVEGAKLESHFFLILLLLSTRSEEPILITIFFEFLRYI